MNQLQSSLFIAFFPSYFHNFFVPILVCEIIIIIWVLVYFEVGYYWGDLCVSMLI